MQGVDDSRGPGLVQHLLDGVSTTPIPGEPPVTITFSAGISYYPNDGGTPEALLEAADKRVYSAKQKGRGRVTGSLTEE